MGFKHCAEDPGFSFPLRQLACVFIETPSNPDREAKCIPASILCKEAHAQIIVFLTVKTGKGETHPPHMPLLCTMHVGYINFSVFLFWFGFFCLVFFLFICILNNALVAVEGEKGCGGKRERSPSLE